MESSPDSQSGTSGSPGFGVVIPNHYPEIIEPLLRSLKEFEPDARVVIIADGHTNDYGFEMIPYEGPFIFSKAINLGIKALGTSDVICLNDDCVLLEPNSLFKLAAIGKSYGTIGILSPLIKGCAGNPIQQWHNREKHWRPNQSFHHQGGTMPVCFPCVWISRELINKIGPMDEKFVGYGNDDNDYCLRARKAGFLTSVTSWVTVQHGDGGPELGEGRGKTWSVSFFRKEQELKDKLRK